MKKVLISALIVTLLLTGCDLNKKEECKTTCNCEKEECKTTCNCEKEECKTTCDCDNEVMGDSYVSVTVVDGMNYTYTKNNRKYKITLPYVFGNTKGIKGLNNKIDKDVVGRINNDIEAMDVISCKSSNPMEFKYSTITKNNIIVINVYAKLNDSSCVIPKSGATEWVEDYYYDINNDKVLTIGEAAQALNLEIKDLYGVTSYDDLNNSCAHIKIENTNLKLVADLIC